MTRQALGRFPAGTPYSAATPELMLWVHATLVHASLAAHARFVAQLSPEEEERYYQGMAFVARLFGTPDAVLPGSFEEFRAYFASELERGDICVTDPARDVASVILQVPGPAPLRLLAPTHRLSTAALLPPRLRSEYGLRWTALHERSLPLAARSLQLGATPLLFLASRLAPSSYPRAA